MRQELEKQFGDALHHIVGHLIKHAVRIPPAVLKCALSFENHTWKNLSLPEKVKILQDVDEQTLDPSEIFDHFDAYPHRFSKERYAAYQIALKYYKADLGL